MPQCERETRPPGAAVAEPDKKTREGELFRTPIPSQWASLTRQGRTLVHSQR
jgi:hypothetical protein